MKIPTWEVPFYDLGKVLEAVPVEAVKIATDLAGAKTILDQDIPAFIQLLTDGAVVVTDKFINFQVDVAFAKEALALLASIKRQLGVKAVQGPQQVPEH